MSATATRRLTVLCLGSAALAALALIFPTHPVKAEKVGVAAAVKPDAFSEGKEVKIGNSVFYNQRINTTGEGLVQVLLVDGSTFTVGPGSDLVIDKFVYDPSKGKGEVVASFSKGVMRFVGGKLSKNEGGVTVNTPSGALAIRGGMFQLKVDHQMLACFIFGVEMTVKNNGQFQRIFQTGYTYDNGNVRPTTPEDTATFMKSLSGGGHVVAGNPNGGRANFGSNFLKKLDTAEVQEEGTQSIIIGQLDNQEQPVDNPPLPPPAPPPSDGGAGGYAGGIYVQYRDGNNDDEPIGALASANPSDVVLDYDNNTNTFKGATLTVFADQGGGAKIDFVPSSPEGESFVSGVARVGGESDAGAISIYHDTDFSSGQPELANQAQLNYGVAGIVSLPTQAICDNCEFLKWGGFAADVNFSNEHEGWNSVQADGFWVTGNLTSSADLGDLRNSGAQATYSGQALASVINLKVQDNQSAWVKYAAWGDMGMNWNFGERKGTLQISKFDSQNFKGGLNFQGDMKMPGVVNKFSGDLSGVHLPENLPNVSGFAQGSFVRGPSSAAQGVIGNWNVGTTESNRYSATGVFGGSGNPH